MAAACSNVRLAGLRASRSSRAPTYSAEAPRAETRIPGRKPRAVPADRLDLASQVGSRTCRLLDLFKVKDIGRAVLAIDDGFHEALTRPIRARSIRAAV